MQATERISIRTMPHAKAVIEQASELTPFFSLFTPYFYP